MARVRWFGTEFTATPVEQLPNGDWRMMAREHTGRTAPGTIVVVKQTEIVPGTMSADDAAPDPAAGLAALDAAMAKEREALPSPAELIKRAVGVPDPFQIAPETAPTQDHPMNDHFSAKLAAAAGVAKDAMAAIESRADALIARRGKIAERTHAVFAPHEAMLDEADKGLDQVEGALRVLAWL